MAARSESMGEVFSSSSKRAFAFLEERRGFRHCGVRSDGEGDPRDQHTTSRYRSERVVVDVALTQLAGGLFVIAWRPPANEVAADCWGRRPSAVVDLDHYLKGRFGDRMPPIFPDLARPVYLSDMFNAQLRKYTRTVLPRLGEAVEAMARRLEMYGDALLTGDPKVFDVRQKLPL
jgi:hypothetical protein